MPPKKELTPKRNEIHIREEETEEYFRPQDPDVLPAEHRVTIRDGFRFGLGFMLATLVVYVLFIIGAVLVVYLLPSLNIR